MSSDLGGMNALMTEWAIWLRRENSVRFLGVKSPAFVPRSAPSGFAPEGEVLELIESIHEAVRSLKRVRPEWYLLIQLRYIEGAALADIAEAASVSTATVSNRLQVILGWLEGKIS